MRIIEGFDFFPLTFDDKGKLESPQEFELLTDRATTSPATDAIFIAHGFRNDAADATTLYTSFLKNFRGHLLRPEFHGLAERRFVVAGSIGRRSRFERATTPARKGPVDFVTNRV